MLIRNAKVSGHAPYGSGLARPDFLGFGFSLSPARFGGGERSGFGRLGAIRTLVRLTLVGQIVAHVNSLLARTADAVPRSINAAQLYIYRSNRGFPLTGVFDWRMEANRPLRSMVGRMLRRWLDVLAIAGPNDARTECSDGQRLRHRLDRMAARLNGSQIEWQPD